MRTCKNPNEPNPTPDQTLTPFDLPKMYVEIYGIHNIEYQHTTIVQSETDPAFIKELKARLDENKIDDDPDQPGVRHGAVDLLHRTRRDASRPSIT